MSTRTTQSERPNEPTDTNQLTDAAFRKSLNGCALVLFEADPDTPFEEIYAECNRRGLVR